MVIFGIPNIIYYFLTGRTGEVRLTLGGLGMLMVFLPLQSLGEELFYRAFIMQTSGSWFKISAIGLITQVVFFAMDHAYNTIGRISVGLSALIYGLICVSARGIEASSALHILNNFTGILMAGLGFGSLTSQQSVSGSLVNVSLKLLFFLFILYAERKLHWFSAVKADEVEEFNEKHG